MFNGGNMAYSSSSSTAANAAQWPALPFQEWKDTYATLHMWTQIVGKIRLAQSPWVNHSWHTTLYLTSRRLVHLGQVVLSVNLIDIEESSLAGERLLLTLRNGEGLTLDVDRPRLLRAEMAAAGQELRG